MLLSPWGSLRPHFTALRQQLRERRELQLKDLCALCLGFEQRLYTQLQLQLNYILTKMGKSKYTLNGIVVVGSLANDYAFNKLARQASKHQLPALLQQSLAPAAMYAWLAWEMLNVGYDRDLKVLCWFSDRITRRSVSSE